MIFYFYFQILHLEPISKVNLIESNLTIVVEVDANGKVVDSLQCDSGRIVQISETRKVGDNLFFGSPYNDYLGRLVLSPLSMEVEGKGVRMKVEEKEKADESFKVKEMDQHTKEKERQDSQEKADVKKETKQEQVHEKVKSDSVKEEL